MSKYEIPFLTACIRAFGRHFSMTRQAAYRYLSEHKPKGTKLKNPNRNAMFSIRILHGYFYAPT